MTNGGTPVDDILNLCGLLNLAERPSMEAVEHALSKLAEHLADISPLRRAVLREGAIRALTDACVRSPAALVDAALDVDAGERDVVDAGRWATHGAPVVDYVRTPDGIEYLLSHPGRGIELAASLDDREPWPRSRLPWPAIPDAGAVLFALEAGGEPPLEELRELILTRVVLPEPKDAWASLLGAWTLGTYLLDRLPYYPLLLLEGPPERGKTRLAKVLTWPAYRGVVAISTSPAMLVRDRAWHRLTLALDVEDLPRTIERGDYLGDLLLASYERGGQVRRCTRPDAPPPQQAECLSAYGATIALTNKPIRDDSALASRSIRIVMPEAGVRAVPDGLAPEEAMQLRAKAVAWVARLMKEQVELPPVEVDLRGRARDLALPLLRVLSLAAPSEVAAVASLLRDIDAERRTERGRSWEARLAIALVKAAHLVRGDRLFIEDLTNVVNEGLPESEHLTRQQVGTARRNLGLRGGTGGSRNLAYVRWPGDDGVRALADRYVPPDSALGPSRPLGPLGSHTVRGDRAQETVPESDDASVEVSRPRTTTPSRDARGTKDPRHVDRGRSAVLPPDLELWATMPEPGGDDDETKGLII